MTGGVRPRSCPRPGPQGFTLVEVLVAVGILGVALLAIITVFWTGRGNISQSGRDTAAIVAAQSLAESLRNQPPTTLPALDGMTTDNPTRCPGAVGTRLNTLCRDWITLARQLPAGRGSVRVAQLPSPATGIVFHQITISVAWGEAGRGGRQLTLVTGRSD